MTDAEAEAEAAILLLSLIQQISYVSIISFAPCKYWLSDDMKCGLVWCGVVWCGEISGSAVLQHFQYHLVSTQHNKTAKANQREYTMMYAIFYTQKLHSNDFLI